MKEREMRQFIVAAYILLLAGILMLVPAEAASPVINSVTVTPPMVSATDTVHVVVDVSDDVGVVNVTADGIDLTAMGDDIWEGDIPANPALGMHSVTVIAYDENSWAINTSGSYKTAKVVGIQNDQALSFTAQMMSSTYLFKVWGKATYLDDNTFLLNDGGKRNVKVISPGHTVCDYDYVVAWGILDGSAPPAIVSHAKYQILVLGPRKPVNINNVTIGKDLQVQVNGSLPEQVPYGTKLPFTITSSDPTKVLLSTTDDSVGKSSITVIVPGGSSSIPSFYVQALQGSGVVDITATAPGGYGKVFKATLTPSGFIINTPGNFNTTTFSGNTNIQITSARLNPTTNAWASNQYLRGGLGDVSIYLTCSDVAVGERTLTPVGMTGGMNVVTTQFDPNSSGTATISIGTPAGFTTPTNYQQITATVDAPDINSSDVTVGKDLQTSSNIHLQTAPPSPVDVVVTVDDPSIATITKDPDVEGTESITFEGVSGTTVGTYYIQGRSLGTTTVTMTAENYDSRTRTITVVPSGFVIGTPGNFSTTTFSNNTNVQIKSARLNPSTLAWASDQPLRAGMSPISVTLTNSDLAVGTIITNPVVFNANVGSVNTQFDPIGAGVTTISLNTPEGFSTPSNYQQITATVNAPNINANDARVGRNLQVSSSVSLSAVPPAPVDIVVTVADPTVATVSDAPNVEGTGSIVFSGVVNSSAKTFYVQGRSLGTTTLTVSAAGYNTRERTITVDPSGFVIGTPGNFTTTMFSNNTNIQIKPARLNPNTLAWASDQPLRPGMNPVNVSVISSNPTVGMITNSPLTFNPNVGSVSTQFDPQSAGESLIQINTPEGFDTPSNYQQITATVLVPKIHANDIAVGRHLQVHTQVSLEVAPPSPVDVTVTVDSGLAAITTDPNVEGTNSIVFRDVSKTSHLSFYVQGMALGSTTLTVSAPGYVTQVKTITIDPSGFIINTPGNFTTKTTSANTNIQITSARLKADNYTWASNQPLRGGFGNVNVEVVSSNTAVGIITVSPVVFSGNVGMITTQFDPLAVGTTIIAPIPPEGFSQATTYYEITATVQ